MKKSRIRPGQTLHVPVKGAETRNDDSYCFYYNLLMEVLVHGVLYR